MAKIYTKTGDNGETGLLGGARVPKDSARMEAIGSVDELNASLGMALTYCKETETESLLKSFQHELFQIGYELASPQNPPKLRSEDITALEQTIDKYQAFLPELASFILPGGSQLGASLHLSRVVCRSAERNVIALSRSEKTNPSIIIYLNRLGDLLFVLARFANKKAGIEEELWHKK